MDVKFGANAQPVPATPEPTATAPAAGSQLPARNSPALLGDTLPTFADIILPRINMVQNIGQLKDSFPSGQIVFNQQMAIYDPPRFNASTNQVVSPGTKPLIMVVLGFKPTRYTEKVEGGFGGMIVNSEAEVRAAGGTLDYQEWQLKKSAGMKRFETLADALVLIQRPEQCIPKSNPDDDPVFTYDLDGSKWTLAFWALKGSLYTEAYKRVIAPARLNGFLKKGGYPSWSFAVSTKEKPFRNGNKSWVPIVVPNAVTSPAILEFVQSVLNPQPATEAAAQE